MSNAPETIPTSPRLDRSTAAAFAIVLASVSGFLLTAGFCIARRGTVDED
jgi:hypothetical protein